MGNSMNQEDKGKPRSCYLQLDWLLDSWMEFSTVIVHSINSFAVIAKYLVLKLEHTHT